MTTPGRSWFDEAASAALTSRTSRALTARSACSVPGQRRRKTWRGGRPKELTVTDETQLSPAAAREQLAVFVANAISRSAQQHVPVGYRVADALLARYDVRERGEAQAQPDGAALIAAERRRQVEVEGWTAEHDDDVGRHGKLARAAAVYATPLPDRDPDFVQQFWPWEQPSFYKPTPLDRVRELTKAGALIAAEIDRLQRAERGDLS